jgi:hypothetical protein
VADEKDNTGAAVTGREVINTHDQLLAARSAGLPDVAVCPRHCNGGRDSWRNGWKVYQPGFNLGDETNRWDWDYGCKVFSEGMGNWRESRELAFFQASSWTREQYGIRKFVRNRMGDFVDERVNKQFPLPKRGK